MPPPSVSAWQVDHKLAIDCASHARLFLGGADQRLDIAVPGLFTLTQNLVMRKALEKDYEAMAGIVFSDVPPLDMVLLHSPEHFEQIVNGAAIAALTTKGAQQS